MPINCSIINTSEDMSQVKVFVTDKRLVSWLVVLRIYVALSIFQLYRDMEAGGSPSPALKVQLISPICFFPSYFIMISFSNQNAQHVFCFFISASQISHMIKIYNINLYAESAESQLLIKIQGLNNCMFLYLVNIFSGLFYLFNINRA